MKTIKNQNRILGRVLGGWAFLLLLMGTPVIAQTTVVQLADGNATIDNDGPNTSPWFHTAQGPGNFESYAISTFTFDPSDFGFSSVAGITGAQISYTQSNAFFTTNGPVEFFVSFDSSFTGASYAGLAHNGTGSGIDDTQFSDSPSVQSLGSGTFTQVENGHVDTYTLTVPSTLETAFLNAINNGNAFSIILSVPSGSTAATYAGIENNTYPDQVNLQITAVPEPEFYGALIGLAALGFAFYRRRKARQEA